MTEIQNQSQWQNIGDFIIWQIKQTPCQIFQIHFFEVFDQE